MLLMVLWGFLGLVLGGLGGFFGALLVLLWALGGTLNFHVTNLGIEYAMKDADATENSEEPAHDDYSDNDEDQPANDDDDTIPVMLHAREAAHQKILKQMQRMQWSSPPRLM